MDASLQMKLRKLMIIFVSWIIIGQVIALLDHLTLHSYYSNGVVTSYNYLEAAGFHLLASVIGSLVGGYFLVFRLAEDFRNRPYWHSITVTALTFLAIVTMIAVVISTIQLYQIRGSMPAGTMIFSETLGVLTSDPIHLRNTIIWGGITTLTQFLLMVNDKFGQSTLWNILRGKYHNPIEEERVFMFLDLRGSTTIAEQLGHTRYYQLLKDLFSDITNPILFNKGEIYQYVGDEVVISWPLERGLENHNCVRCYFDVRETLEGVHDHYEEEYGIRPEFKAGIHYGTVTAGEIGIIKRDITFSGDVLNTAARIQAQCNAFSVDFLSSTALLNMLPKDGAFEHTTMGSIILRGKQESVELSSVSLQPSVA